MSEKNAERTAGKSATDAWKDTGKRNRRKIMSDNINHPSHYTDGRIEVIEYIEDKGFGYHLGNAIKYISRAGKKDPTKKAEDLRKAVWYLERYIEKLEPEEPERPDPKPEKTEKKKDKGQKQIDDGKIKALREGGWTLKEIADEMSLSAMTVRAHLQKMGGEVMKPMVFNYQDYVKLQEENRELREANTKLQIRCRIAEADRPEWIPVSERLPEDTTKPVLISGTYKGLYAVDIARHNGGMWQYDGFTFPGCDIIAWMPLPEPYKGGGSE